MVGAIRETYKAQTCRTVSPGKQKKNDKRMSLTYKSFVLKHDFNLKKKKKSIYNSAFAVFAFLVGSHSIVHNQAKNTKICIPMHFLGLKALYTFLKIILL